MMTAINHLSATPHATTFPLVIAYFLINPQLLTRGYPPS
jgi:hypothetical protein